MRGKVYLVGAGPGDPGLLTVRGRDLLETCDAVIYDTLVNPALLDYTSSRAEHICREDASQEEITELLIARARAGEMVVRLKGGDPFLFGRGGEEAEALIHAGIEWEVVSGVSSALAAPASAGIPVTHRHLSSILTVVAAHDPGRLDWEHLAGGDGTLVFLMGFRHLAQITARLIEHGRPASTLAAVIQSGTCEDQHTEIGTLGDIALRARQAGLGPPAVLVVGEVVSLSSRLLPLLYEPLSCVS